MARRVRVSLFTKTLLWFFLNLLVLVAVLLAVFNLQFRFAPDSPLVGRSGNRLEFVAGLIADELRGATREQRTEVLQHYSSSYQVRFRLVDERGQSLAGDETPLPGAVLRRVTRSPGGPRRAGAPPPPPPPPPAAGGPPPAAGGPPGRPRPEPSFMLRTTGPTRYWAGVRLFLFEPDRPAPVPATLLAESDSISGHGLFFDPRPWLIVVGVVVLISILLWLPFVRGLTVTIRQMTTAAEQLAEERFDTRVNERRSDELGRLGAAVNQLAARLETFVGGQKRFLGDVSHELNSPLARIGLALGILEERANEADRRYVADAQEDVRQMAELVNQLLAFARAGMKTTAPALERVPLRALVERAAAREAPDRDVEIDVGDALEVMAAPELLARALGNVLRNAVRYAGGGRVTITAARRHDRVALTIADRGPGVPPDALDRLFDPFYRLEPDRARATGGTGLGLAIVKASVEACGGTVAARNLTPSGLEIEIVLQAG